MHIKKTLYIFLIFLFLSIYTFAQINPDTQNDRFRAIWVYNIANNVEWPNEDTITTYTIGVYSINHGIYDQLVTLSNSQKIKDKPVKIIHFNRYRKITKTHILYLGNDKNADIFRINSILANQPTLLITDRLDDADNYMVNILPFDQGSKRIELDKPNIEEHLLHVTDQLLYHGGSEDELKDLYSQQKRKLDEQIALMEQKKIEIELLQQDLETQQELLAEQQLLLQTQQQKLGQLTATLQQQKLALQKNENMILEQEQLIILKQAEVQKQIQEMIEKEEILAQKNADILAKQDELSNLEDQIATSKNALNNANNTIDDRDETIKTQNDVLIIVAIFLGIILVFSVFLWKALRKNRKMNKELTTKNTEILEQKNQIQQQASLLESTNKELEKLSIVAENAQNGVVIMDNKGNIEWVNAGFTKMYGYTLQLFVNEKSNNIIKSSSNPKINALYKKCINEKTPVTYEIESTKRNGDFIYVKTTLTPILNEKDEIDKLVAIDTDISEIKKANDEISKQNSQIIEQNQELEKLSIVVRETNNAVLVTDGAGNIEWVNPAFTKTFGYNLEEFTSKVSKNIIADTSKPNVKNSIKKLYKTKKDVSYQLLTHNKEGNEIWIQANLTPILNDEGNIEKIIVVDSDITFIKEAEKEIIEKNYELTSQKEQIEEQNHQIEGSIKYAQTIQASILPLKSVTENYFHSEIIFKPKDIVSGDFYWFFGMPDSKCWYAAAVDCTGHGVPGAFMSLIASRILNEILIKNPKIDPHDILEQADTKIRTALMQEKTNNNDGLDIALAKVINQKDEITLKFAGAKRNLFVYNKKENIIDDIKGTRRSIGGTKQTKKKVAFETSTSTISKGDILYLMTDGFIDQNDKNRKRFGSIRTNEIITTIKDLELKEQKNELINALENHMAETTQRDDITLWIIEV